MIVSASASAALELLLPFIRDGLWLALLLSLPLVGAAALAGILVSMLQAATQVGEQTSLFLARAVAVVVTGALLAPWISWQVQHFTLDLYGLFTVLAR